MRLAKSAMSSCTRAATAFPCAAGPRGSLLACLAVDAWRQKAVQQGRPEVHCSTGLPSKRWACYDPARLAGPQCLIPPPAKSS